MQEPEEGQELAAWQGSHRGEIIDMSLGVMSLEKEEAEEAQLDRERSCAVLCRADKKRQKLSPWPQTDMHREGSNSAGGERERERGAGKLADREGTDHGDATKKMSEQSNGTGRGGHMLGDATHGRKREVGEPGGRERGHAP
jgi:hypothetical protein